MHPHCAVETTPGPLPETMHAGPRRVATQVPAEGFARCVMEQWMDQAERVLTLAVARALVGDAAAVAALHALLLQLANVLTKSSTLAGSALSLADVRSSPRASTGCQPSQGSSFTHAPAAVAPRDASLAPSDVSP
jgi:glutathione S-transferase